MKNSHRKFKRNPDTGDFESAKSFWPERHASRPFKKSLLKPVQEPVKFTVSKLKKN